MWWLVSLCIPFQTIASLLKLSVTCIKQRQKMQIFSWCQQLRKSLILVKMNVNDFNANWNRMPNMATFRQFLKTDYNNYNSITMKMSNLLKYRFGKMFNSISKMRNLNTSAPQNLQNSKSCSVRVLIKLRKTLTLPEFWKKLKMLTSWWKSFVPHHNKGSQSSSMKAKSSTFLQKTMKPRNL